MENQKLLKLSRLFPSSFNSCRSRTLPDVADSSILITKSNTTPRYENDDHSSSFSQKPPKPVTPTPTLINPTKTDCRNNSSSSNRGLWFTSSDERPRAAVDGFEFYSLSSSSGTNSRGFRARERISRRTAACGEHQLGSDHAATQLYYRRRRNTSSCRRRRRRSPSEWVIEEGLVVEKSSSDPYGDFMWSMVEMITEKQIFGAEDLDGLLFCFLALNEEDNHGIIFQVFSEICQTLFFYN